MPEPLDSAIDNARQVVLAHPSGDLELGYRRSIWARMGPRGTADGQAARTRLALVAARHTVPLWSRRRPDDDLHERLLIRAEEVLRGALPRAEADQELEHAWEHLDDIEADGEDIGTVSAGYSAAAALRVALRDELFDPEHLETTVADADVDPEMLDAGFAAASAHAGGPVGDPSSDTERRRSFWLWWLDVAVPQALSAAR